ncbi:two component, sigma54 specific, transcriptional regulator, Fis family [Desulfuromusa kysingii]|uniref:Two component, sigma54 specific, transcriptional regulator, Fis family n=1 Tax=Desulfuromusa kysingii TaxID=37625 RepID=A0A1H3WRI8_9BACT|nr:sigma-54 dependent transcriptional regulator [Desulfuromusa kysingii]SDZ89739.1 two component, sigma54 specific, transcriptional regulator, Fis family [Desulfuromusa kysingii]
MTKRETVLVIDDDDSLRRVIELTLRNSGYQVATAVSGETGLQLFEQRHPTVVITDVQMPDLSGYEVLARIKDRNPATIVIVITAFGTIEKAVRAMREGAHDYITKPFSRDELKQVIARALKYRDSCLSSPVTIENTTTDTSQILGHSPAIEKLRTMLDQVAKSNSTVLLEGESGVGKEVFAHEIHRLSVLADGPFIPVNCAAIPAELLESELFGHVKGSFTGALQNRTGKFAQAENGTLFLDEIGELPLALQPKLLRVLQERVIEPVGGTAKAITVRVIAATNRNLEQALAEQSFREDLYYRLAVITLDLPPLRERGDDINLFIRHFMNQKGGEHVTIDEAAMNMLCSYNWPGNIRELGNCIERMLVLRIDDRLTSLNLPAKIRKHSQAIVTPDNLHLPEQGMALADLEKQAIINALDKNNWNQSKAASFLQVPRHTLIYRMEKYQIPKKRQAD